MLSKDDVYKIAKLGQLSLSEAEAETYAKKLSSILDYMKQLETIDVKDVQPMSHVHGSTNVMREDKIEPTMPTDDALKNAPDISGKYLRVPLIIDQEQ